MPVKRSERWYECCPYPYIDITYTIHVQRRALYYCFNLVVPSALISVLLLFAFHLPQESGQKINLSRCMLLIYLIWKVSEFTVISQISHAFLSGKNWNRLLMLTFTLIVFNGAKHIKLFVATSCFFVSFCFLDPLDYKCNYSGTSNNTKLRHWPLMGKLLHLVQWGGDWAGPQPAFFVILASH